MAGAIKTLPTLSDRAEAVTVEVQAALSGMAAYVLPVEVRATIQKLAHLVEDMARELERNTRNGGVIVEKINEILTAQEAVKWEDVDALDYYEGELVNSQDN